MRTRLVWIFVLLLVPASAFAHMHKAGAYLAYTGIEGSLLNGLQLSTELVVSKPLCGTNTLGRLDCTGHWYKPSLSVFADVAAGWGDHNGGERTQAALMAGLRANLSHHMFEPFAHVALARVRTQDSEPNAVGTSWGFDVGVGGSIQIARSNWRARAQGDYTFLPSSDRLADHYLRFSIGVELRFARTAK